MIAEMKKKKQSTQLEWGRMVAFYFLGIMAGVLGVVAMTRLIWHSKFYPGVEIGSVKVGGMRREEAKQVILTEVAKYNVTLSYNGYEWQLPASSFAIQLEESLNQAYRVGRRADFRDYLLIFVDKPNVFPLVFEEGATKEYAESVSLIAQSVEIPPIPAKLELSKGGVKVINGSDGVRLATEELERAVKSKVARLEPGGVEVPTESVTNQLRAEESEALQQKGAKLAQTTMVLTLGDFQQEITGEALLSWLDTAPKTENARASKEEEIAEYVQGLATSLNREPENAKFEYQEAKVVEFAPGKDGIVVDVLASKETIAEGIEQLLAGEEKRLKVEIVAERSVPDVTMDKVNELGIKERIGRGESYYAHSIPNRIYNVGLASSRINTALIPPGEEVSFNKLVGEVSAATGYRSAYIISQGRTVLGDGGGLCQVSTTLFRAAMSAGLPILERWGHSYRVSYYELNSKPGVDATVIAPSKDFRFKNDTPGHILIQTINDPKALHLVIEIYGTDDGRVATMTEPKVWGITPPLPTVYQDDPSLPSGTVKQVDWSASGARASFEYTVTRNGETLQNQTFSTVYRPWAAVYLRGTGQ